MKFTNILAVSALAGSSLAWRNVTEFADGVIVAMYRIPDGVADPTVDTATASLLDRRDLVADAKRTPTPQPPVCYNNKCLRAMVADPVVAADFCESYLADVFDAAADIGPFQRKCCSPSKASSACACIGQATQAPTTTPTGSPSQPPVEATSTPSYSVPAGPDETPSYSVPAGPDETPATSSGSIPLPTTNPTCKASGASCSNRNFDECCPDAEGRQCCEFTAGDITNGKCR